MCHKMNTVFWVVTLCSRLGIYKLFRRVYGLHHQCDTVPVRYDAMVLEEP
jgi:hypothetical protein